MIAFEDVDSRLAAIGKDRAWLATESGRSPGSIRTALAPKAHPKNRSELLQRALSNAIEREEERQRRQTDAPPGFSEIFLDDAQLARADQASRLIRSDSLAQFCREAIKFRADEILAGNADPVPPAGPLRAVAEDPGTYGGESLERYELPFLGAVAAGEPVEAPLAESVIVPRRFPSCHFVVEINGQSAEPEFPDGSRWVIDGRDKFTPKNGAVCVVSDGSGSYLKRWNRERQVFESINSDFDDVLPAAEAQLQGYPVERLIAQG